MHMYMYVDDIKGYIVYTLANDSEHARYIHMQLSTAHQQHLEEFPHLLDAIYICEL
jgi:hypothetical protein